MPNFPSLSSIGQGVVDIARAAARKVSSLFGQIVTWVKKPSDSTSAANTTSPLDDDLTPTTTIFDRDLSALNIAGDVIEDYGGLDISEEKAAIQFGVHWKGELLAGLRTTRQIGAGGDFSDEQIGAIKNRASKIADAKITEAVKEGKILGRDDVILILEIAILDALLELDQNQGITQTQRAGMEEKITQHVKDNASKRINKPGWNVPEMLGIPMLQDYVDQFNPSSLLTKAASPIMPDVRKAAEGEKAGIQYMQEAYVSDYVKQIREARSTDPDVAKIDAQLEPQLRGILIEELEKAPPDMSHSQFNELAHLYEDICNDAGGSSDEAIDFLDVLQLSLRFESRS